MAQARGFFETLKLVYESTFNTTPSITPGDMIILPMNSNSLGSSENMIQPATIRGNRYEVEPAFGNISVQGSVTVPLDVRNIGYWLKLMLGSPTTSGVGPYDHLFVPATTNPSATLEAGFSDIGRYHRFSGCKINSMTFNFAQDQELTVDIDLLGGNEVYAASTLDSSATELTFKRFNARDLQLQKGGVSIAIITELNIEMNNNMAEDIYPIGNNGFRNSLPEGVFVVSGSFTAMYEDATIYNEMINGTETSIQATLTNGTDVIDFNIPELKFPRQPPERSDGGPVFLPVEFVAYYQDSAEGAPIEITLTNDVTSY